MGNGGLEQLEALIAEYNNRSRLMQSQQGQFGYDSGALYAFHQDLLGLQARFAALEPQAAAAGDGGIFARRLADQQADIAKVIQIVSEMYEARVKADGDVDKIAADTRQAALDSSQRINEGWRKTFGFDK